jgi:hypothetical protein
MSKAKPGIFRGKLHFESQFTQIHNAWIRDPNISYKAKGLLTYLLSHEVGYTITIGQIIRESGDGKQSVRSALEELIKAGYLETQRTTDERGYNAGLAYFIKDPVMPKSENPTLDNPTLENQTALEDNLIKKTTKRENRASKITDDWKPSQTIIDDYETKYKGLNHQRELEKFINYYQSKDIARKSWDGSFRNWLLNAMDYQGIDNNQEPKPKAKPIFGRIK